LCLRVKILDLINESSNCSFLFSDSPSSLSIRYNSLQHGSGGILVGVSKITTHESYSSSTIDYDVAILKLVSNLNLGSAQAKAVQLPAQEFDPPEGTETLVAGWG
jgi:trypsin